jgi:AcrR family transcriptional regulator
MPAESATTRDTILDAAERRFADAGFAGTSVRDIAGDVGLKNQASLYHYFEHKQAIYEGVLQRAIDALVPLWQRDGAGIVPGVDMVVEYLAAHPHVARLIERAGLDDDLVVRGAASRLLRPLFDSGVRVLAESGGPWRADELPLLAAGLYHLIFGYFANASLLEAVMRQDPRTPEMLARQRRFLTIAIARLLGADEHTDDGV